MVDATKINTYNNNKCGLLHIIRIALSQSVLCGFESCPDYNAGNLVEMVYEANIQVTDSLERQAFI